MTNKDMRRFTYAQKVSMKSNFARARLGCVVVYKGKVISAGSNMLKSNPVQHRYNKYRDFRDGKTDVETPVHAEIGALLPLASRPDINWSKVQLYIFRTCKCRDHGMARPCVACMQYIKDLGIKKIFYTTDDGFAEETVDVGY